MAASLRGTSQGMTPPSIPTAELGAVLPYRAQSGSKQLPWAASWNSFGMTANEHVPELRGVRAVPVYAEMRTDARIASLLAQLKAGVRGMDWMLDPNGAPDEVVELVAEDLGIPIVGGDDAPPARIGNRFRHDDHLRLALLALDFGFAAFEQVARVQEQPLRQRLRKLMPLPQESVLDIVAARDGGLEYLRQRSNNGAGGAVEIPATQLVVYSWDMDPGEWLGRALIRPMYKHWRIKDILVRVDAQKQERFGGIVPLIAGPEEANEGDAELIDQIAQNLRSGENAGGFIPHGAKPHLLSAQGGGSDVVASIRYHDEQMAQVAHGIVSQLGQTENGTRSLGEVHQGALEIAQEMIAHWYADLTTGHVIEDLVEWNFGEGVRSPRLVFQRPAEMTTTDLALLAEKGLLTPDRTLEAYVRARGGAPEQEVAEGATRTFYAYEINSGVITVDQMLASLRLDQIGGAEGAMSVPEYQKLKGIGAFAEVVSPDTPPVAAKRSIAQRLLASMGLKRTRAAADPDGRVRMPDRELRRQPYPHEVRAAADFKALDEGWDDAVATAVAAWSKVRAGQIDALVASIEAAGTDPVQIAAVTIPVAGSDVIKKAMQQGASTGIATAVAEAAAQGVKATPVKIAEIADAIDATADATAAVMTSGLTQSAVQRAVSLTSTASTPDVVAAGVREHLETLTDAYPKKTIGSTVSTAQNAGRVAQLEAILAADPEQFVAVYASEILDANTCGPCRDIDGTRFKNLEEAADAYPAGQYIACDGGDQCRGLLVFEYDELQAVEPEDG